MLFLFKFWVQWVTWWRAEVYKVCCVSHGSSRISDDFRWGQCSSSQTLWDGYQKQSEYLKLNTFNILILLTFFSYILHTCIRWSIIKLLKVLLIIWFSIQILSVLCKMLHFWIRLRWKTASEMEEMKRKRKKLKLNLCYISGINICNIHKYK